MKLSIKLYSAAPTEQYELDFDKIKTVEDCVLVLKAMLSAYCGGQQPRVIIGNTSRFYDEMKHLAKNE